MRRLRGQSDVFKPITMVAQVADVKSTLVSVHRLLEAGNRVHFEPGNCYVEHIKKGMKTRILEKNGAFEVGLWVPRVKGDQEKGRNNQEERQGRGNQEERQQGFARQDN